MTRRRIVLLGLAVTLVVFSPRTALSDPIAIVEDRIYRQGVFLIVDALVANRMPHRVEAIEAMVELRDFFGALVRLEYTVPTPVTLGPGQIGALRVVTPYSEAVRRLQYRFTWRQNGEQFQSVVRRDIWMIGSATRAPNREP